MREDMAISYLELAEDIAKTKNTDRVYYIKTDLFSVMLQNLSENDSLMSMMPVEALINYVLIHAAMAGEI